jgi:uncharacterized metal-binding protein
MTQQVLRVVKQETAGNCAACLPKNCEEGVDCAGSGADPTALCTSEEDVRIYAPATRLEAEDSAHLNRIEELIALAKRMGIQRIGLAFCIGLSNEARLLHDILSRHFEVTSVCCKVGSVPKDGLGLPQSPSERFEAACNPLGQARLLNEGGTELNVVVGLCLGHDMLFSRHSAAPATTLIVKDRVLGHNPVAALHSSYHRQRLMADEVMSTAPSRK